MTSAPLLAANTIHLWATTMMRRTENMRTFVMHALATVVASATAAFEHSVSDRQRCNHGCSCIAAAVASIVVFGGLMYIAEPASAQTATTTPSKQTLNSWREGMARLRPPNRGCFTASYPSTHWQQIPCSTVKPRPYPPRLGGPAKSLTVGDGNDVIVTFGPQPISMVIGSFDSVTGVTSETGETASNGLQANAFSLQLNSSTFQTPLCSSPCVGWQQFVFSNYDSHGVFIQYWLLHFASTDCPPGGWTYFNNGGDSECYLSSKPAPVPIQSITNLVNMSLRGQATAPGSDMVTLSIGSSSYSVQDADVLDLPQGWGAAEFNVFGDCCGYSANFNAGSTIVVRTSVNTGTQYGLGCLVYGTPYQGYTQETNNLGFGRAPAATPGMYPAIVFTESYGASGPYPCNAATVVDAANSLLVEPEDGVVFNGPQGGPFFPNPFHAALTATSGNLDYSITGMPSWLTASPASGTVGTGGTTIAFTANAYANALTPGTYGPYQITFNDASNSTGSVGFPIKILVTATQPTPRRAP
jgi:hypothetical protein